MMLGAIENQPSFPSPRKSHICYIKILSSRALSRLEQVYMLHHKRTNWETQTWDEENKLKCKSLVICALKDIPTKKKCCRKKLWSFNVEKISCDQDIFFFFLNWKWCGKEVGKVQTGGFLKLPRKMGWSEIQRIDRVLKQSQTNQTHG